MRDAKTHFEQIPVEMVLRIARKIPGNHVDEFDTTNMGTRGEVSSAPAGGWREVALQIQQEQEPKAMSLLVQKLIAELDEEKLRKNGSAFAPVLHSRARSVPRERSVPDLHAE